MFDSIFSWLAGVVGKLCDWFLEQLVDGGALTLSIQNLIDHFPAFSTLYSILQAIALGLLLLIAGTQIIRFFIGGAGREETPLRIAVGSLVGAGLIYFGNHAVDLLIKLANLPYTAIWNANTTEGDTTFDTLGIITNASLDLTGLGIVKTIVQLIFAAIILKNIFAIAVEIFHHLFTIGLLTFTSPLAYCTVASGSTIQIFKKWLNMLVSELVVMSLIAWGLKLVLASLPQVSSVPGFLFLLAACKVVQKMDSYVNQLGLNTATSGAALMGDIRDAAERAKNRLSGNPSEGASGAHAPALGSNFSPTGGAGNVPKNSGSLLYGAAGHVSNAIRQGKFAAENGGTVEDTLKAAKNGFSSKAAAIGALAPAAIAVKGISDAISENGGVKESFEKAKAARKDGGFKEAAKKSIHEISEGVERKKTAFDKLDGTYVAPGREAVSGSGSRGDATVRASDAISDLRASDKERINDAKNSEALITNSDDGEIVSAPFIRSAFGGAVMQTSDEYIKPETGETFSDIQYSNAVHSVDNETGGHRYDFTAKYTDDDGNSQYRSYSLMDAGYVSKESDYERAVNSRDEEAFTSLSGKQYYLRDNGSASPDNNTAFTDVKETPVSPGRTRLNNVRGDATTHAYSGINEIRTLGDKDRKQSANNIETNLMEAKDGSVFHPQAFRTAFGSAVMQTPDEYVNPATKESYKDVYYTPAIHSYDKETGGHRYDYYGKFVKENGYAEYRSYSLLDANYTKKENGFERAMNSKNEKSFTSLKGTQYYVRDNGQVYLDENNLNENGRKFTYVVPVENRTETEKKGEEKGEED